MDDIQSMEMSSYLYVLAGAELVGIEFSGNIYVSILSLAYGLTITSLR